MAGREKEGELATTSLDLNSTPNSPVAPRRLSCHISAKARSENEPERKQTLKIACQV